MQREHYVRKGCLYTPRDIKDCQMGEEKPPMPFKVLPAELRVKLTESG